MNSPNQQRWRNLLRGGYLARYIRLNSILDSSSVKLSIYQLSSINCCQPISRVSERKSAGVVFYILGNVPLQPYYDFQAFYSAIVWRLIQQYTRIAGDTS